SLLLKGTSLPWMAKLLKVTVPPDPAPISRAALEVHVTSEWELFVYRLGAEKWCIGAALRELKMPEGTRIAALFRGQQLLHPSGSTTLEVGDLLCVIGHEHDLPALGKLFSQAPQRGLDLRFFGDFVLEGDARLGEVAALYGLKLDGIDPGMPLSQFIVQKNRGEPVVGDQIEWNGTIWTVAVMDGNKIQKVGVKFPEGTRPGPGLFL
ncbi:potassium/proton antiporter, partial [Pseudomonas syringae pv. pisi str. 1704B]